MVEPTSEHNRISGIVVDSASAVHRALGPGLSKTVYEQCLAHEMTSRSVRFARQISLPVTYRGARIEAGLRLDFVVERLVVVELMAVEQIAPIHEAQLLTYLKLSDHLLGLLLNFNVSRMEDGVRRIVRARQVA
jgi:GxxExxY protein